MADNEYVSEASYTSTIQPHTTATPTRVSGITTSSGGGARVLKMVTEMGSTSLGGMSPALSASAAKSFLEAADKEKKTMRGLNESLDNYIDRVKKLEERNRKMVEELEDLRSRTGKDEIKVKYYEKLSSARKARQKAKT